MKVKVCGITTVDGLKQLQEMNVAYAGLIFYPPSKRYAAEKLKSETTAIKNIAINKVGVFVNESMDILKSYVAAYGLHAVQLHGDETPDYCGQLQNSNIIVIKVFRLKGNEDIDTLVAPYQNVCAYYLFDTDTAGYGGSGKSFNWSVLQKAGINKPFFLSGGIGAEDRDKIKSFSHPYFYAIDINSRFETEPGIKDMDKIKSFIPATVAERSVATGAK